MASATQTPAVAPHLLSSVDKQITTSASEQKTCNTSRDVTATFNYFKDNADGSPPRPVNIMDPSGFKRDPISQQAVVHDIRGSEDQYTLDTTGFQIIKHESAEKEFNDDDEEIKKNYYPEVEDLLRKITGASKIRIFDHTIRRQHTFISDEPVKPGEPAVKGNVPANIRGPVRSVHIDQSDKAAHNRVIQFFPDEAEKIFKGRYQIINVWRPIKKILKDPLALCASDSVLDEELVPIQLIYPHRVGETMSVRPAKESRTDGGHKWYYLSGQTPEEVMLIKCNDSKTDGRARRTPHSSFIDEEFKDAEARESIEVRALVVHFEKGE